jgi:uncharacterized membrane protein YkoI
MRTRTKALAAAAFAVLMLGGGGIAAATVVTDDDATDEPISGDALDRASETALEHIGEGEVTETEVGDEESYYEVEVTLDDGSEVDVQLDRNFHVTGTEGDGAREGEGDPGDD